MGRGSVGPVGGAQWAEEEEEEEQITTQGIGAVERVEEAEDFRRACGVVGPVQASAS
jgi:hypothetical protein